MEYKDSYLKEIAEHVVTYCMNCSMVEVSDTGIAHCKNEREGEVVPCVLVQAKYIDMDYIACEGDAPIPLD